MNQKKEQSEECFLKAQFQILETNYLEADIDFNLQLNIHKQLPPNQLRSIRRPQLLVPRTFYNNRQIYLLCQQINQKCVQEPIKTSVTGINRIQIGNKQKLSIQQYFKKKDFACIYNRLIKGKLIQNNFMGQIRSIQANSDYNHKMYKELSCEINLLDENDQDSVDADFQSGNICKVFNVKNNPNDNYLIIQNDLNTHGYNNWFFFRYRNCKKGTRIFNIVSFIKKNQNYKKGMKISIFSRKKYAQQKIAWQKGGHRINFGQTNFLRMFHDKQKYFYLSFQYNFQYENDEVYFAYNQPYTYTRMVNHLEALDQFKTNPDIVIQKKTAGYSIANNIIPMLTIRSNIAKQQTKLKTILITARQHPGQTVGSFLCQSLIDYLISDKPEVKKLLQNYQFIVIPMINPDGVIHGSSRCNLAGFDLNRQWGDFLIKQFTPQTCRLKNILSQIHLMNPIKYAFDLHGHGKKFNSFLFSCRKYEKPSNRILQLSLNKLQPRFNIFDCTYGIDRDKENTIRSQLYQMGINHVYTVQNSHYGYTCNGQIKHYNETDFNQIAKSLVRSVFILDSTSKEIEQLLGFTKQSLFENVSLIQKISQKQQQNKKTIFDNASDSDPDGDILNLEERIQTYKNNKTIQKKLKQEIKKNKPKLLPYKNIKKTKQKEIKNYQINLADSCPNGDYFNDDQSSQQKKANQNLSQRNKQICKIVLKNKKSIIYNHRKVRQKRQSLNETKIKLRQKNKQSYSIIDQNSIMHKTQLKLSVNRDNQKSLNRKMCSSVIYQYPPVDVMKGKKRHSLRSKTQQSKIQQTDMEQFFTQDRKVETQAKFSQLKQQSLKSLLNDTFSILKIQSKYSIKGSRQIRKQTQNVRSNSWKKKLKVFKNANLSQRVQTQGAKQLSKTKQSFKYKRFQSFLKDGRKSNQDITSKNFVFYYFPVL